jgi:hypothetical protein
MRNEREIALTEVYLDKQANLLRGSFPRVSVRPDVYVVVGQVCALAGFVLILIAYWRAF